MSAQVLYSLYQPAFINGQRASGGNYTALSYLNPLLPQVGTNTVAGTIADGQVYTITFTPVLPTEGAAFSVSVTRAAAVPVDNTAVAAALVLLINTTSAALGVVSATNAAGVITYTMRKAGAVYTVTSSATGTGTLVSAVTQVAGGTSMYVGGVVMQASPAADLTLSPIKATNVLADVVGFAEYVLHNSRSSLTSTLWSPGRDVSVGRVGRWAAQVWEAVTAYDVPATWIDPADATAYPGQLGKTVTASKSIALTGKARYLTSASAGGLAVVEWTMGG
jgi:hypothetical protein